MRRYNFVILGVVFWLMIGWVSINYGDIEIFEYIGKGLQYIILGGIFGDCLYYIVKDIIKEYKE